MTNTTATTTPAANTATPDSPGLGFYFFNPATGDTYGSETELPKKRTTLYLVLERESLFFHMLGMDTKKKVKESTLLHIQSHFVPFKNDHTNIIYGSENKEQKKYFSWLGAAPAPIDNYCLDEIPESLLFKGNPNDIKNYSFFVFRRARGVEVIYFHNSDFYSLFVTDEIEVSDCLVLLARKFSLTDTVQVLSEVNIDFAPCEKAAAIFRVNLLKHADKKFFFLPHYFPVKKKYSNISQNKQATGINKIFRHLDRNLNIILVLLAIMLVATAMGMLYLGKDNRQLQKKYEVIETMLARSGDLEFRLNNIRQRLSLYPDHMRYIEAIANTMIPGSILIGCTLAEDKMIIEGYAPSSLEILNGLRKSGLFKEVKFKSTVIKNVNSDKEKFEIEMILPSAAPEEATSEETKLPAEETN